MNGRVICLFSLKGATFSDPFIYPQRIRAREARLLELGLSEELSQLRRAPGTKPQPATKRKPKPPQPQEPLRRSSRNRGIVKESDPIFSFPSGHPVREEEAWEPTESSVKHYMLNVDPEQYTPSHSWEQTGSFQLQPHALHTMGLARAYRHVVRFVYAK